MQESRKFRKHLGDKGVVAVVGAKMHVAVTQGSNPLVHVCSVGKHSGVLQWQGSSDRFTRKCFDLTKKQVMSTSESEGSCKRPRPCFYEARVGYQDIGIFAI